MRVQIERGATSHGKATDDDDMLRPMFRPLASLITLSVALAGPLSAQRIPDSMRAVPAPQLFNTRISMPAVTRTGLETLEAIVDAVAARSGKDVRLAVAPVNVLVHMRLTLGGDMPAHEAVERLIRATGVKLSWQLLYDPRMRAYYFSLTPS